ncbi:hypothetical protein GH714_023254 [Hevea brasiliensis]|uniref:Protein DETOXIFICATION n=1 Tax=Hevea brasiliensis TaxID=3981 RepID=A0A6A6MCM7_HEVBR|nr:hypothetical protein GH714_023254 [Hevea brasiliensis]
MGSALETFCGQAYEAQQYHMLGVYMQRAMLVLVLTSIPISLIWHFTGQIFISLKQDPQISIRSGIYARWLIPAIVPYGLLQCQLRFLQTQNIVWPLVLRFSRTGTKNLLSFLKLGIPSALMVCLELWSYEFLVIMSGLLPNPKLELSMMSIRIPFGLGSAVSPRVSNELGAGRPYAAHLAVQIEVVRYLAFVAPVLALSNFMDGIQTVLSGTARGCGWQKIGACVNLGAYYLVGLPSAIVLTFFFHLGGKAKKARVIVYASRISTDTPTEVV